VKHASYAVYHFVIRKYILYVLKYLLTVQYRLSMYLKMLEIDKCMNTCACNCAASLLSNQITNKCYYLFYSNQSNSNKVLLVSNHSQSNHNNVLCDRIISTILNGVMTPNIAFLDDVYYALDIFLVFYANYYGGRGVFCYFIVPRL
jgi:hypothetical protein